MISDILEKKELICSLEVFPPKKTDDVHIVYKAIDEMKSVEPDFISVTYGARRRNEQRNPCNSIIYT